jgi:hypothetical protein
VLHGTGVKDVIPKDDELLGVELASKEASDPAE